ncbi:MAG: TonB-dependent receptor [Candidatus Marinimicrobia bacterium]|nr:TonB-dependent receptor [Candidatus Neomarinimicrobiota bacterium]
METTVSAAGGNERTQFFVSGQHQDEGGSIVNTGFERWSGRINLNHRFSEKTKLALTTNLVRVETDRGVTGNDNSNITYGFSIGFMPSFIDVRQNDDGSWPDHPLNPSNPLHTARVFVNNEQTNRAMGSARFEYSFLKKENMSLDWVTTAGVDFYSQRNKVFSPAELQYEKIVDEPGQSVNTTTNSLNTNLYTNLVHRMILPGNINLSTTAGLQYETLDWDQVFVHAKGMVVGQTNVDQASSADVYHTRRLQQDRGFFVQEEVNVNDQIYVAFGLRGDKSSTLGDTEEWNTYPKFSASYQAGALAGIFDDFKARLAWGQTGNLPSPTAKFTSLNPINIDGIGGLIPTGILGNEDIEPERTTELEYGVDFSFLKGLGSVEFTLYQQNIENLILEVDQAASSGAVSKWMNAAEMETKGTELSLLLNPIRSKSLNWMSRINYYKTASEITKLDVDPFNMGGFATFLGTYRIEKGWSPTSIIGSDTTSSGGIKKLGDETPDFQMSFNNTFKFSSFTLQFLLDVKQGGYIINLANFIYDLGGTTADYDDMTLDPDKEKNNGEYRLDNISTQTAPLIEDGSYVKLREVSLFYDFSNEQVNRWFSGAVTSLRLGVSGRNLATWTDYTGLDPEVSQFGNIAIGGSVDTNPFPSSRSVYLSISMGF